MSSYTVVAAVSEALRRILWQEFDADPVVRAVVPSEAAIVFKNPTETASDNANRLSLWLYQVTENEFVKNQPPMRANGADTLRPAPLALNLAYLVTPFAPTREADHLLLGKTMQVLYDSAATLLRDPVAGVAEELRIILARLTLEELTRVWEALREPYRLSVGYHVRVNRIDSERTLTGARVLDRVVGYAPAPLGSEV